MYYFPSYSAEKWANLTASMPFPSSYLQIHRTTVFQWVLDTQTESCWQHRCFSSLNHLHGPSLSQCLLIFQSCVPNEACYVKDGIKVVYFTESRIPSISNSFLIVHLWNSQSVFMVIICAITTKTCLRIRVWSKPLVFHRGRAVVAHTFDPSTGETEADGSLCVQGCPGLH